MSDSVAVLAFPGISPFHLAVPSLVLGKEANRGQTHRYDVTVCAEQPGPVPTDAGFDLQVSSGLAAVDAADMVVVPSWNPVDQPSAKLLDRLRQAHGRGARLVGLCLGAFPIAAAGVLDGREVVTHWAYTGRLAQAYPQVRVRPDVLWSDHGDVVTSAGVAAALDCCLHLVRRDFGSEVAAGLARNLVLAPHRSGNQAQFISAPVPADDAVDPIERAMVWARHRLQRPLDLDTWSAHAAMSRSTFTRRFRARAGMSPGAWLLQQRLDRARQLLETTDLSVEQVAVESGFATAVSLRHHFGRVLGTSPRLYRTEFRDPALTG
ncbi:helix-turn-helix domain-containing protein [Nocardioidaceae bacterium SCSIO 66511]|nr:helix-turn-helix domain-containing protein [Nocardioidaceae bacterium SCSIO 66511]